MTRELLRALARHLQDDPAGGAVRHFAAGVLVVTALGGDLAVDAVDVALQVLAGAFDPGAVRESELAVHVVITASRDLLGGAGGRDGGGVGGEDGRGLRGGGLGRRLGSRGGGLRPRGDRTGDGGAVHVDAGTDCGNQRTADEAESHVQVRLFLLGRGRGVRGRVDHGGCDLTRTTRRVAGGGGADLPVARDGRGGRDRHVHRGRDGRGLDAGVGGGERRAGVLAPHDSPEIHMIRGRRIGRGNQHGVGFQPIRHRGDGHGGEPLLTGHAGEHFAHAVPDPAEADRFGGAGREHRVQLLPEERLDRGLIHLHAGLGRVKAVVVRELVDEPPHHTLARERRGRVGERREGGRGRDGGGVLLSVHGGLDSGLSPGEGGEALWRSWVGLTRGNWPCGADTTIARPRGLFPRKQRVYPSLHRHGATRLNFCNDFFMVEISEPRIERRWLF